jgi:hypothetical protein
MLGRGRQWETPVGRWAKRLGVSRITQGLRAQGVPVTRDAVYKVLSGRRAPGLELRTGLNRLSKGRLHGEDIDRHVLRMRTYPSLDRGR